MKLSSPRFKSLTVTAGFSFWFLIIISSLSIFSFELLGGFIISTLIITQIFALKLSKVLDIFTKFNTKIFLGLMFICVISLYGFFFRLLRIDLLRLKSQEKTYWLDIEPLKEERIFKQY